MNKAEWSDFFFYVKDLFKINKTRKVEKTESINDYNQDLNDKDTYQKNSSNDCYSKKRKKHYNP